MKFRRFSTVALSIIATINLAGCGGGGGGDASTSSNEDNKTSNSSDNNFEQNKTLSSFKPFVRVVELDGKQNSVNDIANNIAQSVNNIANDIAQYIYRTDEVQELNLSTNWEIVRADNVDNSTILNIPLDKNGTNSVAIVELYSQGYNSSKLPYQIAVYNQDSKIYVDILQSNIISTATSKDEAQEIDSQISQIVQTSLKETGEEFTSSDVPELDYNTTKLKSTLDNYQKRVEYVKDEGELSEDSQQILVTTILDTLNSNSSFQVLENSTFAIGDTKVIEVYPADYNNTEYTTPLPYFITVSKGNKTQIEVDYLDTNYIFDISSDTNNTNGSTKFNQLTTLIDSAVTNNSELDLRNNDTTPPLIPEKYEVPTKTSNN